MNKNFSWETLVSIVIWVIILSFIMFWIMNLYIVNQNEIWNQKDKINIYNIKENTKNIVDKINLQNIQTAEEFYINKNETTKNFEVSTWSSNSGNMYVDKNGNKIDKNSLSDVYERKLKKERSDEIMWIQDEVINIEVNKVRK